MKPQVGDTIRVFEEDNSEHICTVVDTLSVQLRATYEYARPDGGWIERSMWVFYADAQWNARAQEWQGKSG